MKPLFQPSLRLIAVAASVSVNMLLAIALNATLTSQPSLSESKMQLPTVTIVAKRSALASPQLATTGATKSF